MGRLKKENGWEGWKKENGWEGEGEWMGRKRHVYLICNWRLVINPIYWTYFQYAINFISKGQILINCLMFNTFYRNVSNSPFCWYEGRNVQGMCIFNTGWKKFEKISLFQLPLPQTLPLPTNSQSTQYSSKRNVIVWI